MRRIAIILFMVGLVGSSAAIADDNSPRTPASILLAFCEGDMSYGAQPTVYCSHYANGVLDAVGTGCLPPYVEGGTNLVRTTIVAWLRDQVAKNVDISSMSGAEAIQSAIKDTFCPDRK